MGFPFSTNGGVVDHQIVQLNTLGVIGLAGDDEAALSAIVRQPKTLALLVYLAMETRDGFCLRDRVVGVFWPDLEQGRARAALRNTLYSIRRGLPTGVIQSEGDEALRVVSSRLWCDAVAFEEALAGHRDREAIDLYHGDFMAGFHLAGSHEFGSWRDAQHRSLQRKALEALLRVASSGRVAHRQAAAYLERAVELAPADDEPVQRLIAHHLDLGSRGAAVAAYRAHRAYLESLDLLPSPETEAIFHSQPTPEHFEQPSAAPGSPTLSQPSDSPHQASRAAAEVDALARRPPGSAPAIEPERTAPTRPRKQRPRAPRPAIALGLVVLLLLGALGGTRRPASHLGGDGRFQKLQDSRHGRRRHECVQARD